MAPPSGYPNPFSLFSRVRATPPGRHSDVVDEEEAYEDAEEDDYDTNHDITQGEYEGIPIDQMDPDDEIDEMGDMEGEELDEDFIDEQLEDEEQMEDEDEEMHDRGKTGPQKALSELSLTNPQKSPPNLSRRISVISHPSLHGPFPPTNQTTASRRCETPRLRSTGNLMARNRIL